MEPSRLKAADIVIQAKDLGYRVQSRRIIDEVSLSVPKGSFTVVVGENGAGKTTLLKLLMGFAIPTTGSILVNGRRPHQDPYRDRQRIAYINERMTPPNDWAIEDYLVFNRTFYEHYSLEIEREMLRLFKLDPGARIGNLSGGEVRRIQVVAALAMSPEVLLIDEITAVLDIVGRSKFMAALRRLQSAANTTVVMATNIIDDVDAYATDIVLLHQGRLALQATKEELVRSGKGASLTEVLASLIEQAEAGETVR